MSGSPACPWCESEVIAELYHSPTLDDHKRGRYFLRCGTEWCLFNWKANPDGFETRAHALAAASRAARPLPDFPAGYRVSRLAGAICFALSRLPAEPDPQWGHQNPIPWADLIAARQSLIDALGPLKIPGAQLEEDTK